MTSKSHSFHGLCILQHNRDEQMPGQDHTRDGFASETWHGSLFPHWPLPTGIHSDLLKLALIFVKTASSPQMAETGPGFKFARIQSVHEHGFIFTSLEHKRKFKFPWGGGLGSFPGSSEGKQSTCNAEEPGLVPGSGRFSGDGNGNPL